MKKSLAVATIGLLLGLLLAIAVGRTGNERSSDGSFRDTPGADSADLDALLARVEALERAVEIEREARQILEEELFSIGGASALNPVEATRQVETAAQFDASPGDAREQARVSRLVEQGFDHATAEWILTRESELQYEALQRRYEVGREQGYTGFYRSQSDVRNMLREELGDANFERYLAANGMATDIQVSAVLDASPARQIGLLPGDRITRYDGRRVFSVSDMNRSIMEGAPGEPVVLEFVRDGVIMQAQLPRGPVGIAGGRR